MHRNITESDFTVWFFNCVLEIPKFYAENESIDHDLMAAIKLSPLLQRIDIDVSQNYLNTIYILGYKNLPL